MQVIYSRNAYPPPTPAHMDAIVEWCRSEGLEPADIPSGRFAVLEDEHGNLFAVFQKYVRFDVGGHTQRLLWDSVLPDPDNQRKEGGYVKTDWQVRPVATRPPTFEPLWDLEFRDPIVPDVAVRS